MSGKKRLPNKLIVCMLFLALLLVFAGCGRASDESRKIVLTTGFDKDEVFRIEDILQVQVLQATRRMEQYVE